MSNTHRIIILAAVALAIVAMPSVQAESAETVYRLDCSGLSGTVECVSLTWNWPERVDPDAIFMVTYRVSSADTDADQVEFVSELYGGCILDDGSTSTSSTVLNPGSFALYVEMNGASTCAIMTNVTVQQATPTVVNLYPLHASSTTVATAGPGVATASLVPGLALPVVAWGAVLVWAMFERMHMLSVVATLSVIASVANIPWASAMGVVMGLAALWAHYGSRSMKTKDAPESGVSA